MNRSSTTNETATQRPRSGRPRRRWLRYSLRTLFLLVLLASILAWLAGPVNKARRQGAVVEQIRAAGGTVYYDYQEVEFWSKPVVDANRQPEDNTALRRILGNDFFDTVIEVHFGRRQSIRPPGVLSVKEWELGGTTDHDLALVQQLPNVRRVVVIGGEVSDDGLRRLSKLNRLESVQIEGTKITVEGAQAFAASRPGCRVHFRGDDSRWVARTWPK
jgi:hypothetical protein